MSGTETDLLELAVNAARAAGALLLGRAEEGAGELDVSSKSTPTDLVSEADVAAEAAIREVLLDARPNDGFVGEEGEGVAGSSGVEWVVDPLDGTVNYLFGIPQWCVSVAARDSRGTCAGAIYDPNREELFTATRGGTALLRHGGGEEGATVELDASRGSRAHGAALARGAGGSLADVRLADALLATGLAYDAAVRERQAAVLARLIPRVRDIRRLGSAALDLAWTAAGRCDAYFERTVKEWDIAAGLLICERAGLAVAQLEARAGLPWGVAAARRSFAAELLEIIDTD